MGAVSDFGIACGLSFVVVFSFDLPFSASQFIQKIWTCLPHHVTAAT